MARSRTAAERLPSDRRVTEASFSRGLVTDMEVPQGGLLDVTDWIVDQPGMLYKRGGWERHSAAIPGIPLWVGTIHIPTRVIAINDALDLYDITSENSPTVALVGAIGRVPIEKSPTFHSSKEHLIITDRNGSLPPKLVRYDQTGDTLVIEDMPTEPGLGQNPPAASFSAVHAGICVLAKGGGDYDLSYRGRVWFGLTPVQIAPVASGGEGLTSWNTGPMGNWINTGREITGLASVQGTLLIFSTTHTDRIIGSTPFGVPGSDMRMQPALNVGCLDARSIANAGEEVIFAGEEGVWITNGSAAQSLTYKPDGTGIQSYWRSLFPRHHTAGEHNYRQLIGGMLNRDYYLICMLDHLSALVVSLLCHVPTRTWTKVSNVEACAMAWGRDEQEIGELYWAESQGQYVNRAVPILYPEARNKSDGDGGGPSPHLITRNLGADNPGMKAYGFGWLSYKMANAAGATLSIGGLTGLRRSRTLTPTSMGPTDPSGANFTDRQRFPLHVDTQAMYLQLTQSGASEVTEIDYLEVEERAYPGEADSLGR